jgi:hypothetical protein
MTTTKLDITCRECGRNIEQVEPGRLGCPYGCECGFPIRPEYRALLVRLTCPCCGECDLDVRLVPALLRLWNLTEGAGLEILSGYRCSKYNRSQPRGFPKLAHAQGRAADLKIPGKTQREAFALAESVPEFRAGGIGAHDDGSLHVDVRVFPTRWARVAGKYVSLSQLEWREEPAFVLDRKQTVE